MIPRRTKPSARDSAASKWAFAAASSDWSWVMSFCFWAIAAWSFVVAWDRIEVSWALYCLAISFSARALE